MTTIERTTVQDLLEQVERIRPVLEGCREENERECRLADAAYDAMIGAGLFRMLAPAVYGGYEMHPVDINRVVYAVSKIDAAAGWNLQIAGAAAGFAAFLPTVAAAEVFANGPDVISAGAFFPPAAAVRVPGGWRVSGRTPFASGCQRADWILMPAVEIEGGTPKINPETGQPDGMAMFLPKSDVHVVPNWNTMGMRGTGSHDVAVEDVFVPEHRMTTIGPLTDPPPSHAGPLYRLNLFNGVHSESIPSVATAERAVEDLAELAKTKVANYATAPLAQRELVQHHLGKARSLVGAAKSYLDSSISAAYANAARDGHISEEDKIDCQLAGCFAAEASATAVDLVYEAAGSSGFRLEYPFERYFRDVHTLTQHASKSVNRYASVGQVMLGLTPDWFLLQL
jgi:alkylation response protein AidB-like acyl-CoA dehydrogenase